VYIFNNMSTIYVYTYAQNEASKRVHPNNSLIIYLFYSYFSILLYLYLLCLKLRVYLPPDKYLAVIYLF